MCLENFSLPFTSRFRKGQRMYSRVFAIALLAAGIIQAQEPAARSAAPKSPAPRVLVAGENPAIRLLDKEGGKAISNANFWRVEWSPVGAGAVCFLTVNAPGQENLRIAIYDDKKVLDYVTTELMSSLMKTFNEPAYTPVKGTITQTNEGSTERKETCKSDRYNVSWGFVEVLPDRVTILANDAVAPAQIDVAQAQQLLDHGRELWSNAGDSEEKYAEAQHVIREAEAKLASAENKAS